MAADWAKWHTDILDCPKVMTLSPDVFRAWALMLLVVKRSGSAGIIPPAENVAFIQRITVDEAEAAIAKLIDARLVDDDGENLRLHDYSDWQNVESESTERVRRYRARRSNVTLRNVTPLQCNAVTQSRVDKSRVDKSRREEIREECAAVAADSNPDNSPQQHFETPVPDKSELTDTQQKRKPPRFDPKQITLPPELAADPFPSVWSEWISIRREAGWSIRERCLSEQLKSLSPLGPLRAADCIRSSIRNGWTGIFPEKMQGGNANGRRPPGPGVIYDEHAAERDPDHGKL